MTDREAAGFFALVFMVLAILAAAGLVHVVAPLAYAGVFMLWLAFGVREPWRRS